MQLSLGGGDGAAGVTSASSSASGRRAATWASPAISRSLPTVVNLTNHAYSNLAGAGDGAVLDQVAMINANKITPVDSTLIPIGKMMDVARTDLGFTTPTPIGAHIHAGNQQLKYAEPKQGGYDFNYVLSNPGDLAASVTDPKSGRTIEMYTNEPGVQFYSSNFLNDMHGKDYDLADGDDCGRRREVDQPTVLSRACNTVASEAFVQRLSRSAFDGG